MSKKNKNVDDNDINFDDLDLDDLDDGEDIIADPEPKGKKKVKEEKPKKKATAKKEETPKKESKPKVAKDDVVLVEVNCKALLEASPIIERDEVDVSSLTASIKEGGLLNPIIVNTDGVLVAGYRRLTALVKAKKKTTQAIVRNAETDQDIFLMALTENEQREDLSVFEKARAFRKALDEKYVENNTELAKLVGLTSARVGQILSVLEVDEGVQELIVDEKLSTDQIKEISKLPKEKQQEEAEKQIDKKKEKKETVTKPKKSVLALASQECPDNMSVKVTATNVIVSLRIDENTRMMKGFSLADCCRDIIDGVSEESNRAVRRLRAEVY